MLNKVKDHTLLPLAWMNEVRKSKKLCAKPVCSLFFFNKSFFHILCPLCNQTATLDDKTADMFKRELLSRIDMLEIVQQVLLIAGVIIFCVCLIAFFCVRRKSKANLG